MCWVWVERDGRKVLVVERVDDGNSDGRDNGFVPDKCSFFAAF
jgi:hypothetical protein